jgi:hypothetical protein
VLFSKIWKEWRDALIVVKPETVILWHKKVSSYFGNSNPEKEDLAGHHSNQKQGSLLRIWPKPIHYGEHLGFMESY